ncbi:MAG: 6-carboxytetrahydropterin synthase QueD [Selenomonadaceae bacterium]|nr:6-carboxytetrahydropterin synthase QueD [Selenomonadaceae bacterium]MBR1579817.1 6-carboxytetrahydropterin synthase QueD [Selenomonadaceae bacterium]
MYELTVRGEFEAAHRIVGYEGKCRRLHGHNWSVEAVVRGRELDRLGMLIDFKVLKGALNGVLEELDHQYLNELETFERMNPTAENLARHIFERLSASTVIVESGARVSAIKIYETAKSCVMYMPDEEAS